MLPVFTEKQALRKEAKAVLEGAEKVLLYRQDILSDEVLEDIKRLEAELKATFKAKEFNAEKLEQDTEALKKVITEHGGKIFPISMLGDWVEMLVMAAIVAGGIRSFFLQPFKIPTNSMWPTYNGMTSVVRAPSDPTPTTQEQILSKITDWSSTYVIKAEASGIVKIPLEFLGYDGPVRRYRLRHRTIGADYQEIYIGNRAQAISVPQDFNLEGVFLRTFYPNYATMPLRRQDNERWEKVIEQAQLNNLIEETAYGPMLKTSMTVQAGENVLNFDILTGDMLFVDRVSYNFVNPSRGDTFVFRTNHIPGLAVQGVPSQNYYVKRIAGTPGDKLRVDNDGKLFVNSSVVTSPEPMVLNSQRATSLNYYGYLADIGNFGYSIPLTSEYQVTAGHYYALGDNSANSYDSRGWGEVPEKDVVGRPLVILHPFGPRWGWAK
jgi:signal peptidase I